MNRRWVFHGIVSVFGVATIAVFISYTLYMKKSRDRIHNESLSSLRTQPIRSPKNLDFSALWLISKAKMLDKALDQSNLNLSSEISRFRPIVSAFKQSAKLYFNQSLFDPFSPYTGVSIWDIFPPIISCPTLERIGNVGEGGKWVCGLDQLSSKERNDDNMEHENNPCIVYSFGISTDISFENEILRRTNCIIHAFDPSVGKLPFPNQHSPTDSLLSHERVRSRSALNGKRVTDRIIFHKIALSANRSGPSDRHLFTEHLLDSMHRLRHAYIHILKLDIEGAEWAVFQDLFSRFGSMRAPFPVGQVLIELHYQSNERVLELFSGAIRNGFYPFSREINLQPCIAGGKPVAVEYSFLNPERYFLSQQQKWEVPLAVTDSWHAPIHGVIYFLTQHRRFQLMSRALKLLYVNFLRFYPHYPVVLFHDDFTAEDQLRMAAMFPDIALKFVQIELSFPDGYKNQKIPERTACSPQSSTLGYRHMCRFHAFLVHNYLIQNGFQDYEYVLRLDDDGQITRPVGYDLFRFMKENQKLYGFVNIVADGDNCVAGLQDLVDKFVREFGLNLNANNSFLAEWKLPRVFYNNFEISHRSLWSSAVWTKFQTYVDETWAIYTHRWGDAPLRTMGAAMMLSKQQVHAFTDLGYRHDPFIRQEATGLPSPIEDPFLGGSNCRYYDKWICDHGNFTSNFSTFRTYHFSEKTSGGAAKGVLYSFGHSGREMKLAATMRSLFKHYARAFGRNIIVFYSAGEERSGYFNASKVKDLLPLDARSAIQFISVVLDTDHVAHDQRTTEDVHAASSFLRFKVFQSLKSFGYEVCTSHCIVYLSLKLNYSHLNCQNRIPQWFLRFSDDSQLMGDIRYDVFDNLQASGRRYGFMFELGRNTAILDRGRAVCSRLSRAPVNSSILGENRLACQLAPAAVFKEEIILSAFEVSHISVWESATCLALLLFLGEADAVAKFADRAAMQWVLKEHERWKRDGAPESLGHALGEAEAHTVCVELTLTSRDVRLFDDILYRFDWNFNETEILLTKGVQTASISSSTLPQFDAIFSPQRGF